MPRDDDRTDRIMFDANGINIKATDATLTFGLDADGDTIEVRMGGRLFAVNRFEWACIGAYLAGASNRERG